MCCRGADPTVRDSATWPAVDVMEGLGHQIESNATTRACVRRTFRQMWGSCLRLRPEGFTKTAPFCENAAGLGHERAAYPGLSHEPMATLCVPGRSYRPAPAEAPGVLLADSSLPWGGCRRLFPTKGEGCRAARRSYGLMEPAAFPARTQLADASGAHTKFSHARSAADFLSWCRVAPTEETGHAEPERRCWPYWHAPAAWSRCCEVARRCALGT